MKRFQQQLGNGITYSLFIDENNLWRYICTSCGKSSIVADGGKCLQGVWCRSCGGTFRLDRQLEFSEVYDEDGTLKE